MAGAKREYKNGKTVSRALQLAADLGKVPPQAVDVEENILGVLLNETRSHEEVFSVLKEPGAFYKESHSKIFGCIRNMYTEHEPITVTTVIQKLQSFGELEIIGGGYYLNQLTNYTEASANPTYWCVILLQFYIKRELIRVAGETMRDAYESTTDSLVLMEKAIVENERIRNITSFGVNKPYKVTAKHIKSERPIVLTLQGEPILTRGNINLIIASPGTGKSQLTEIVLASHIRNDIDTLGFHVHSDKKVLLVDTERDVDDAFDGFNRIQRRTDGIFDEYGELKNIEFWSFRKIIKWQDRRMHLRKFIESREYDLILLDGYAHFISNINDVEQSEEFVSELMSYTSEYRCGVMGTLHNNFKQKDAQSARGHLGGAIMREAYTYYAIKRDASDTGLRILTSKVGDNQKNRGGRDDLEVYFRWNDELKMFMGEDKNGDAVVSNQFPVKGGVSEKPHVGTKNDIEVCMDRAFKSLSYASVRYKQLVDAYISFAKCSVPTAGRAIQHAMKMEIVNHDKEKGVYWYVDDDTDPF